MVDSITMSAVPAIGGVGRGEPGTATAGSSEQFAQFVREFAEQSINAQEVGE